MEQTKKINISLVVSSLQLVVMLIGIAGLFITIGKKDAAIENTISDMTELKAIVQDLLKAQITVVSNDATHNAILNSTQKEIQEIKRRLEIIERRSNG